MKCETLDDGHPEDDVSMNLVYGMDYLKLLQIQNFLHIRRRSYQSPECMDMDFMYMGEPDDEYDEDDDMFLDDHEGEDEPMGPMDLCYPPMALWMLMSQTDLELEFEGHY